MLVHITTSRRLLTQDPTTLNRIVNAVKVDHKIIHDWISSALKREHEGIEQQDILIYRHNMEYISKADVIIAEASEGSFGVGYQVAVAVQQKKPVLILCRKGHDNRLVKGIDATLVKLVEYSDDNLESIITNFLLENDIKAKDLRFNFFIDRKLYNYLRWMSYKTGESKSSIVRKIIEKEIDKG
jgi:hypothetical protein